MKKFSLLNLPSCENMENYWQANGIPAYALANFALCAKTSDPWGVALFKRMDAVRTLLAHGTKPFYANEVFGNRDDLGGLMNALDIAHIIAPTGNTREQFIDFGDGYGRMVTVKEWELTHSVEVWTEAYAEVKQFIVDRL